MQEGFEERLRNELRSVLPTGQIFNLKKAADPQRDAWRGAARFARDHGAGLSSVGLSRAQYDELGHDYLIEHPFSSPFFMPS